MDNSYLNQKNKTYKQYKKIRQVFCPYLKTNVIFNSNGFRHLIHKNKSKKRDERTQLFRFKLLHLAPKLIRLTSTLQEEDSYISLISVKDHRKNLNRKKKVQYLGFIAIIDGWKIKVIVKKIGKGEYFFWSIIPNWITSNKRDKGKKYINFSGDLESD